MFLHIKKISDTCFFKKRKPYEQLKDAFIDLNVRESLSISAKDEVQEEMDLGV